MLSIFNAYVFSHISIISKIKVKNDLSLIDTDVYQRIQLRL